ncbi:hypothetical protein H0H93_013678 [Arthromyces matolae]|nr:hypothetical protein H0H93_013678 [Arthromyces matolae]
MRFCMSLVSFPVRAKYVWSLVFDYDNSANEGSIEQRYIFEESGSLAFTTFNESITSTAKKLAESGSINLEAGVSYGPVSASMGVGFESSKEINDMLKNATSIQSESTMTYTRKEERTYRIGPFSRLCLYQRYFEGPGMSISGQATRTTPKPLTSRELEEDTSLDLVIGPVTFVKDIKVVYDKLETRAPIDRVRTIGPYSSHIGDGNHSPRYLWLVEERTTKVEEALTRVEIAFQDDYDSQWPPRYVDLMDGEGPAKYRWRYLIPVKQSDPNLPRITQLGLYRSFGSQEPDLKGYEGRHTQNINQGRGGGFLYLMWDAQRVNPTKSS